MELTAREIEGIPRGNLRVPRAEFVAVWAEAERRSDVNKRQGKGDWYVAGVLLTCRWMAGAMVPSILGNGLEPAFAPVSGRKSTAHEELIESESLLAEREAIRYPGGMEGREGWVESVVATFNWAWRGTAGPPLKVDQAQAG